MTSTPDGHGSVAAVVVTYNRKDYLSQLLPSLLASTRPLDAIYVVDNASTDGTQDFLAEHYGDVPTVKPVLLTDNTGGSGGFYSGVLAAYADGHDWFWLMDDDVTALPDGLEGLLRFADRSGCIHGRRVDFHGGPFFWQPADERVPRHPRCPTCATRSPTATRSSRPTPASSRACWSAATSSSKIGPPDPRFFITWDDAVYALRGLAVATKVVYVDHFSLKRQREQRQVSLAVRHLNDASDLFRFHVMRNRGYMAHYLRHLGAYNALGFALGTLLTFLKEMLRLVYVEHSLHGTRRTAARVARVAPDAASSRGSRSARASSTPTAAPPDRSRRRRACRIGAAART